MKYVLVISDGMADTALPQLEGKTPMEALDLPGFDRCAGCFCGRALTVPHGMAPGSDTAILSIFGYDPRTCYTGRSVLEAAGMGVTVQPGEISFRVNLCAVTEDAEGNRIIRSHNGGGIHGEEVLTLMGDLVHQEEFAELLKKAGMTIHITDTFRHIGIMKSSAAEPQAIRLTEPHNIPDRCIDEYLPFPVKIIRDEATIKMGKDIRALMLRSYDFLKDHPINKKRVAEGKLPANMIWPWGAATAMTLTPFKQLFGHEGAVISAVPLVKGIAALAGLPIPEVEGANGDLDTNYEGKAECALEALKAGADFTCVHVEAPDEMAHAGDLSRKMQAIKNVESRVVTPMLEQLTAMGEDFRLMVLSDHPTLLTTRTHDGSPIPYAIYDSRTVRKALKAGKKPPVRKFCEEEAAYEPVLMDGTDLMKVLFQQGMFQGLA